MQQQQRQLQQRQLQQQQQQQQQRTSADTARREITLILSAGNELRHCRRKLKSSSASPQTADGATVS